MSSELRKKILNVESLPSPPALVAELLELTSREDVRISEIASLIERDPALSAKLLKLCNSAAFGIRQEISTLDRAMVMLGIRQVKSFALGFLVLNAKEMQDSTVFDFSHFWRRASVTAVSAKALAKHTVPNLAGEAFACGLMLDIGMMLLQHLVPDVYRTILTMQSDSGRKLYEVEREVLELDHMEAGQLLLNHWGLPPIITETVGVHHCPQTYEGEAVEQDFLEIVATASEIAVLFCDPQKSESLDRVMQICSGYFRMAEEQVHEMLKQIGDDAREAAWLFELKGADSLCYDQVRVDVENELTAASDGAA